MKSIDCNLQIIESRRQSPDARWIKGFQAQLNPDCCAHGSLMFAIFEVWEDEPETFQAAKTNALNVAVRVMAIYAQNLLKFTESQQTS